MRSAVSALNLHALLDNRTSAAITRHVALSTDLQAWARAVVADVAVEVHPFGVLVERLDFTQNGTGVALKNLSDWTYADQASGKRES